MHDSWTSSLGDVVKRLEEKQAWDKVWDLSKLMGL